MKIKLALAPLLIIACLGATAVLAGTAEQEKAFTDKYKAAFEAKDTATLQSPLHERCKSDGA